MTTADKIRADIVAASRNIYESGLTCSTGGNISICFENILYISKTDTSFSRLRAEDIIACDLEGMALEEGKPSKEVGFHAAIYRQRTDVHAVVHVHAPYAVALGAYPLNKKDVLPPCTYGAVTRVGKTPLVEFYSPGHPDLIRRVAEEVPQAQNAIYLAKHGFITFAADMGRACDIAEEFEQNARIYVMTAGKVPLLAPQEIETVRNRGGSK